MDYNELNAMARTIGDRLDEKPLLGIVLGSGLSYLKDYLVEKGRIDYKDIKGHPVCTNKSHSGSYIIGTIQDIPAIVMDGRLHYYEGYSASECTIPERLLGILGIRHLILTNAVGGITAGPGTVLVTTEQIASLVPSPLRGENIDELGPRFPDMSEVYDPLLSATIAKKAKEENLACKEAVFMQFPGPQFETKAEVEMARRLGADSVGMSTGIEAIASRHMGIKNIGLSLVTNWACGIAKGPITDEEVLVVAKSSEKTMRRVFEIALEAIADDR